MTSKWPPMQDMRNTSICDMVTEGWSGHAGDGHSGQLQLNDRVNRGPKRKRREQLSWLKNSQIQLPWHDMSEKFYHTQSTSESWGSWHWQYLSQMIMNQNSACVPSSHLFPTWLQWQHSLRTHPSGTKLRVVHSIFHWIFTISLEVGTTTHFLPKRNSSE